MFCLLENVEISCNFEKEEEREKFGDPLERGKSSGKVLNEIFELDPVFKFKMKKVSRKFINRGNGTFGEMTKCGELLEKQFFLLLWIRIQIEMIIPNI